MEPAQYTVHLISHKADIRARKNIVGCINADATYREFTHDKLHKRSRSVFECEGRNRTIIITLIDIDYDLIDRELDGNDIVFVNVPKQAVRNAKSSWLRRFEGSRATLWYTHYRESNTCFGVKDADLCKSQNPSYYNAEHDDGADCWRRFIEAKFDMKDPIQTKIELLCEAPIVLPVNQLVTSPFLQRKRSLLDGSQSSLVIPKKKLAADLSPASKGQHEIPWPLPKMSIVVPKYVGVSAIEHDPETGVIEITFE